MYCTYVRLCTVISGQKVGIMLIDSRSSSAAFYPNEVPRIFQRHQMKAKTNLSKAKSRRGFTLVEMLVVIGMIAALAGISFPVYRSIQKKVDKQQAMMLMDSIERAADNFETEYNYLPYAMADYPTGTTLVNGEGTWFWVSSRGGTMEDILGLLMGLGNNTCNFKNIVFLEGIPEAEGSGPHAAPGPAGYSNGVVINEAAGTATLYNSFGMHYACKVDYDRDGTIENPLNSSEIISGHTLLFYSPLKPWAAPFDDGLWMTNFGYGGW